MKCEKCGSEMKLQEFVYISDPVRYGYKCPKCGNVQYSMIKEENNQMDYEKLYKNALERAKIELNADTTQGTKNVLMTVFPELSDSDEKIRKEIADFIYISAFKPKDIKKKEKWLTWLEKQGTPAKLDEEEIQKAKDEMFPYQENVGRSYEQALAATGFELGAHFVLNRLKSNGYSYEIYKQGVCDAKQELEKQGEPFDDNIITRDDEILQAISIGLTDAEKDLGWSDFGGLPIEEIHAWLEKQGNQKPVISYDALREGITHFGITQYQIDDWLKKYVNVEKQGEQKPADKYEPKFHKGEWIVWENKCYKVNYNGCGYELIDQNGLSTSLEYGTVDTSARLYDITKDAKDGDVLISQYGNPLIYNGNYNSFNIGAYCGITCDDNKFKVAEEKCKWTENVDIKPATKEQRDILEKAMDNAGWKFDFDKKELKKIEDEIEIPFGAKDSELIKEEYYIPKGFHAEIDGDKVVIKKGEKSAAWSDEDEERIKNIFSVLDVQVCWDGATGKKGNPYQKEINWLKSLKDRATWKPSEEQMEAFEHFVRSFGESGTISPYSDNTKLLYSILQDLKKL